MPHFGISDKIRQVIGPRRIGPTLLVAGATVGLPTTALLAWGTLGFWRGSWTTVLMVIAFNAGLAVGFLFRVQKKDDDVSTARPRLGRAGLPRKTGGTGRPGADYPVKTSIRR